MKQDSDTVNQQKMYTIFIIDKLTVPYDGLII